MASWNYGPTPRLNGSAGEAFDLKALLSQVTGGGVGGGGTNILNSRGLGSLGGLGGGGGGGGGSTNNSRCYGNSSPGIIGQGSATGGGLLGSLGGSLGLDGGNGGGSGSSSSNGFFDPFTSMSTFGYFNPKDPSSNLQINTSNNGGGGGGGGGGMGHHGSMKSPNYNNSSHSPVFGGGSGGGGGGGGGGSGNSSHSPIHFFSNNQQYQSNSNNSSNNYSSSNNKSSFPIGNFSIDDTMPERNQQQQQQRQTNNSIFDNDDGGNNHFGSSGNSNNSSNHFGGTFRAERDGSYNNRDGQSSNSRGNNDHSSGSGSGGADGSFNQGVRETGIIEKLLHSYGFIQCCERQARLFFHFSQFDGTIEHLKLGDPVEFEMTYDRRTGKPIASSVTKIGPEVVLSEERVTGTVTTELHHESSGELQGRISYENRGECFFLPYCQEDIEGNVTLSVGDTVSFQIATNQRSGNLTARYVRLENPARPVRYKGIVSSLKDNFGFIERADVAKEIFFHFSETRMSDDIGVNDNVEFNIQTRNSKEVACTITKLPHGTVVFEDIGTDILKGQILKPLDKSQCVSPTLGPTPRSETAQGRLRYRGPDRQELEVIFGEKDQNGTFTMKHGDWVQFQLAVDRRNKQQRATNVTLLEESFGVSGERREEGVISVIKGDVGYIACAERDCKMFFRFSELLDYGRIPRIADDVAFTIIQDPTSPMKQSAIRIKYLKHGTVQFEIPVRQGLHGAVVREPSTPWVSQEALVGILPSLSNLGLPPNVTERLIQSLSSAEVLSQLTGGGVGNNEAQGEPGVIQFQTSNAGGWSQDTIIFHWKDCKNLRNIRVDTKVVFDIHQVRKNKEFVAANIRAEDGTSDSPLGSSANLVAETLAGLNMRMRNQNQTSPPPSNFSSVVPNNLSSLLNNHNSNHHQAFSADSSSSSEPEKLNNMHHQHHLYQQNQYGNGGISPPPGHGLSSSSTYSRDSSPPVEAEKELFLMNEMMLSMSGGRRDSSTTPSESGASSDMMIGSGTGVNGGMESSSSSPGSRDKSPRVVMKGYIAALKDGFGFIETMAQDGEIFFHSSSLVGDFSALEVGQEVEYVVSSKPSQSGKNAADIVKPLPKGSIGRAAVFPDILQGVVVRPLRGANPDQSEYTGLIDGQDGMSYIFGIISMLNKKELLQAGEAVEFQLDAQGKPVNIRAIRKKMRAAVEAVKDGIGSTGQYGFLSYELEDGKKLFFHMSEVKDHQHLNPGDEVEFVILQNPRNGKSSACSVVKVGESQRPERLLNRVSKVSVDESGPRLVVVRQPYGPDGTKGFNVPRLPRRAGSLASSRDSSGSN